MMGVVVSYFLILAICLLGSSVSRADEYFKFRRTNNAIFEEYNKIHKKFFRELCSAGAEQTFWQRVRRYSGDGHYIPVLPDGSLDREAIENHLPLIREKIEWIAGLKKGLIENKNYSAILPSIRSLKNSLKNLLRYKQQFLEASTKLEKDKIRTNSKLEFYKFRESYTNVLKLIPFLMPFKFPVSHFELRKEFDKFKFREDTIGNKLANKIFFYRKIVEDGAQNPNLSKNDIFLRTMLNSLYFELQKNDDFIPEETRYDLSSILTIADNMVSYGQRSQIARMEEWLGRENRKLAYYMDLLRNQVHQGKKLVSVKELLDERYSAREDLTKFVNKKQAETYIFWSKQEEIHQALFVLETILFNEVGNVDGPSSLERKDVIQVVLNRRNIDFYSTLGEKTDLYNLIQGKVIPGMHAHKWLNVLFKEGEFSFTYYFITANIRIFCPDMSAAGRKLRTENTYLALEALRHPRSDFPAVRYFSRASMIGRINMAPLWDNFAAMAESPGSPVEDSKTILQEIQKGNYTYLYYFSENNGETYKVIEVDDQKYVVPLAKSRAIYHYRDPNLFKFFRRK